MQRAYMNSLYQLIQEDKDVISVLSDSGTDYDEMLKREFPEQCINLGIAEENLIGVAAGLAASGKIPFVYTSGAFLAYRAYEFIRDDVCLQNNNVKIVGMGSGLAWSTLGPSHHTLEDISALRAIPNLLILSPASPKELEEMVKFAYQYVGPVYIRMGMSKEREIYTESYQFRIQTNIEIREGSYIAVFTTGSIIEEVLLAKEILEKEGIDIAIINVPCLKPFDVENIKCSTKKYAKVVSVEEHNIYGGLGSIISEIIAENGLAIKLKRIGLQDCFTKGYGTIAEVREQNNLNAIAIAGSIKEFYKNE